MIKSTNSPMVKDDIMFWVIVFGRVSTILHDVDVVEASRTSQVF